VSVVTSLTLICALVDGEGDEDGAPSDHIAFLNGWLKKRNFGPLVDVSSHSGGTKHPQTCTFHCGYNYFPEDEFVQAVLSALWENPENVVLIMQPEDGATRVFRPKTAPVNNR